MTTSTMMQAKALYANSADTEEELSFAAGDLLTVHERDVAGLVGWWLCSHAGRIGIAPGNRLRLVQPNGNSSGQQQNNTRREDSSSTTKPRPSTAPQRGHTAQSNGNVKNKIRKIEVPTLKACFCVNGKQLPERRYQQLVVPYKAGNVYVYDDAVHQSVDYDVPAQHYSSPRSDNTPVTAVTDDWSSQDYDVPTGVPMISASFHCADDDAEFGMGDYDLLTPPQRPASDVDCSISSNRSSVTSVISGGSLSSGCASVRSAQSPSVCMGRSAIVTGARMNGCEPHQGDLQSTSHRVSEATSESSADSGIVVQATVIKTDTPMLNGVFAQRNGTTDDPEFLDYDVPMASTDDAEERLLDMVNELRAASQQSQSSLTVKPVMSDELHHRSRYVDDVRRGRVDELRDCVMRSAQRFLAWTGRATGDACSDPVTARHCYGQAKLAGLAVRTSLKELVAAVDGNPPALIQRRVDPLNRSLLEINRRLDSLIASGADVHPQRVSGRRAARESTACRDQLLAVSQIVADLPELVRRFADFVATTPDIVLRPRDDIDVIQSPTASYVSGRSLPPTPPQRRDSHQRDKPPQSPPVITGGGNARARRPALGKPPPVKPKPPKSVTWKRPPQTPVPPRPAGSPIPPTVNGTFPRPNSAKNERTELNKRNAPTSDGWNEDDCDYVSIVREVEREMESLGKSSTGARLNDDDLELLAFYSAQIRAHSADVDAASADFYRCSSSSPSVDAFVRRSRFVVLAAHRLVYVGDVIARHITDQSVREQVAAAANDLCDQLKAVVMATRDAAIATSENSAVAADVRQTMTDSVRRATEYCHRLCDIISAISCQ